MVVHLTIVNWQKFRSSREDPCTSTTYEVWRIVSVDEKHPKLPGAGTSTVAITRYHSAKLHLPTGDNLIWDDVKLGYYLNHPRLLRLK